MKATLLGSGTALPSTRRGSPGAYIENDETGVLIDPGSGTGMRLARAGIGLLDVDVILISHFHLDHVGDLAPLLFAMRNPRFGDRSWPSLVGPRGFNDFYRRLRNAHSDWLPDPSGEVELLEWAGETLRVAGLDVAGIPVVHTDNSLAYRITNAEGGVLTWSGDTEFCEGVVEAARDADLLILECSFPNGMEVSGHLNPGGVSRVVRESGARRVVLTHFYPECDEVALLAQIDEDVRDRVTVGEDGAQYRVR